MNKEAKLNLLKNRLNVLRGNGKENAGVIRKIERQIRKLEAE